MYFRLCFKRDRVTQWSITKLSLTGTLREHFVLLQETKAPSAKISGLFDDDDEDLFNSPSPKPSPSPNVTRKEDKKVCGKTEYFIGKKLVMNISICS